jgi:hypothetical protein
MVQYLLRNGVRDEGMKSPPNTAIVEDRMADYQCFGTTFEPPWRLLESIVTSNLQRCWTGGQIYLNHKAD